MTAPDDPMLTTLREEIRTGAWPQGVIRTKESLRRRFGETHSKTSAVVSVLRRQGLLEVNGGMVVRARKSGTPVLLTGPVAFGDLIVATIRARVQDGTYASGFRLPDLSAVANEFGVTPQAVRIAFTELKLEGILRPHRAGEWAGSYPVDHKQEEREARLVDDLHDAMVRGGWWRADFPEAVQNGLQTLVTRLRNQALHTAGGETKLATCRPAGQ